MIAIRKRLSGQKGFTLIELLVVVAILGILATVAVPRVMDAIDNARAKKALADMTVIRDGLERFYLDYGVFPSSLDYLVSEGYIDPNFTFTNSYGKVYLYMVQFDGDTATTSCKDYNLADPGKTPILVADWDDATSTVFPVGLYSVTAHTGYYWGAHASPADVHMDLVKNTDSSTLDMISDLTGFHVLVNPVPEPDPALIDFTYKGQQD